MTVLGVIVFALIDSFNCSCSAASLFFYQFKVGCSPLKHAITSISGVAFLGMMSHFLTLRYPAGLLQTFVAMPWWLGG